MPVYAVNM